MKKFVVVLVMAAMAVSALAGCSGNGTGSGAGNVKKPKSEAIDLTKIDWSVESGMYDGDRTVVFGYTNNTGFDIGDFTIKFIVRDDVSEDDLMESKELVEKAEACEDDLKDLTFEATTHKVVHDGESVENQYCTLNGTIELFTDFDAYELFEPDIMTVVYVNGDKAQVAYYDFKSGKTTIDESNVIDAYTWSDSELAKAVPKPEVELCRIVYENEDSFTADAFGVSADYCNEYIEACKASGFTKDAESNDSTYSIDYEASNEDGIKVDLNYSKYNEELYIDVSKED